MSQRHCQTYLEISYLKVLVTGATGYIGGRLILPVPFLAPQLAALWVGLVTPIPNSMAIPLIEEILHPLLADSTKARDLFPHIVPIPYRKAVELALQSTLNGSVETRWSDALGNPWFARSELS